MTVKRQATVADLYAAAGKAELIDGELVLMSATGGAPSYAAGRILRSLSDYEDQYGSGVAIPDGAGFLVHLPRRQSFSPDAAFYVGPDPGMRFFEGAPMFAVEVRSEHDYGPAAEREIAAKRADYFAAGTEVVWDVDLLSPDVVRVYRATVPDQPTIYRRGDQAEAEPAVPGWSMPVDDIFRRPRKETP
jgi:Uma2 family endonuclease